MVRAVGSCDECMQLASKPFHHNILYLDSFFQSMLHSSVDAVIVHHFTISPTNSSFPRNHHHVHRLIRYMRQHTSVLQVAVCRMDGCWRFQHRSA